MSKRKDAQPDIVEDNSHREHPERPAPDPVTNEGPGDRDASGSEEDARNEATRRGER